MHLHTEKQSDDKVANGKASALNPAVPTQIRHRRIGVWDHYEEIEPTRPWLATAPLLEKFNELIECWPYVVRMFKDVLQIPGCPRLVLVYGATELGTALIPALTIWFQGRFLHITQVAIDTRTIDKEQLIRVSAGMCACTGANWLMRRIQRGVVLPLNGRIRRWWAVHSFHARARLDVPTYEQGHVQRQLSGTSESYRGQAVVWQTLELVTDILSTVMQLVAQLVVLFQVLRGHNDGVLLGILTLISETIYWVSRAEVMKPMRVWVATTLNQDYLRMHGWKCVIRDTAYRKEFVAGNLAQHATSEFRKASTRVGDLDSNWNELEDFLDVSGEFWYAFYQPMKHIPQIIFTLRAARYPASIPVSLASLNLVQDASTRFAWAVYDIIYRAKSVEDQLRAVRKVYEVVNIPNLVPDGTVPFPEDTAQIRSGISLEFKNVSFKYPETEKFALKNISFSVGQGQLCVIVGANGSGKSTILKLVTRIYDPVEGQILLNGQDIRTLKLCDLREAISVLFQDYSIFPLSIRDNIALGDPASADDDERVRLAARLAGAEALVDKLPDGFDSFLERPVDDEYCHVAEGTKTLMGRVVDYTALREAAKIKSHKDTSLSGGQMQRLAVARTFMRSVVQNDTTVGLLLFDEPSAALDPAAEHDLFNRLRELRGSKTMVFSSHRFGNLTRHADLILYMDETGIVETGTHNELLKTGGEYARLWKLQAQAFVEP